MVKTCSEGRTNIKFSDAYQVLIPLHKEVPKEHWNGAIPEFSWIVIALSSAISMKPFSVKKPKEDEGSIDQSFAGYEIGQKHL